MCVIGQKITDYLTDGLREQVYCIPIFIKYSIPIMYVVCIVFLQNGISKLVCTKGILHIALHTC